MSVSSSSASSGFLLLFFSKRSQYLARSSGDLLLLLAALVTELLLMKRPQALSSAATKPLSLLNATSTRALYFLCTSSIVFTYTFGSCTFTRIIYSVDYRRYINRLRTFDAESPHLSIAASP